MTSINNHMTLKYNNKENISLLSTAQSCGQLKSFASTIKISCKLLLHVVSSTKIKRRTGERSVLVSIISSLIM